MERDVIVAYNKVPYAVIEDDIPAAQKENYNRETDTIINLYKAYEKGQEFTTEGSNLDYVPSTLKYKKSAKIVNKEARFLFANPPTFNVNINDVDDDKEKENSILQSFLDEVLEKNNFNDKLLKAAKDCFVAKRVAIVLNFSAKNGITITFLNALSFIYETDSQSGALTKIVTVTNTTKSRDRAEQRWFKKIYSLEKDVVYAEEKMYDGGGKEIEVVTRKKATKFSYIPAVIVLNDGLTGDVEGVSELGQLLDYEEVYSKLSNADIDAGRKSMNPIRYTVDASVGSTEKLPSSPGSYWDLQSDEDKGKEHPAKVGILEPQMNYSEPLNKTLERVENTMHDEVDVPNITSEQLKGVITSGKTISALYWGLTVRCDEKMLAWGAALVFMANAIIEGGKYYAKSIAKYTTAVTLPTIEYHVKVENNYPLPEDIIEEKNVDLAEVNANVMSRKAYLKKWRKLSDKKAEEELRQIKEEMDLFENSVGTLPEY